MEAEFRCNRKENSEQLIRHWYRRLRLFPFWFRIRLDTTVSISVRPPLVPTKRSRNRLKMESIGDLYGGIKIRIFVWKTEHEIRGLLLSLTKKEMNLLDERVRGRVGAVYREENK